MLTKAFEELRHHAPFTFLGAICAVFIFILLRNIPDTTSYKLFYIFHPLHVFLSAFVTASMYKLNKEKPAWVQIILVGFFGSIGIATLSDSIFPYIGETILNMPYRELHLGFIEKWYIVDTVAFLGIFAAMIKPSTKFPHSGHVFVSTLASLFHIMMSIGTASIGVFIYLAVLFILFISVWVPCCFSDIIFPLLFVKNRNHAKKLKLF